MSLRLQEEMERRAASTLGNQWNATVALLRKRLLRWLGILEKNLSDKDKTKIARECFEMVSHLMRRRKLADIVQRQVRAIEPDFDPAEHYCMIERDRRGGEKSRRYIPMDSVPDDLYYVRHVWHICEVQKEHVDRWVESLELFADGLYELTGTAIIQKMLSREDRVNYAIDPMAAEEISAEVWGNGEPVEENKEENTE